MEIDDALIDYAAALAKLTLTEQQRREAAKDLGSILGYIEGMNGLDTEGVEPLIQAFPLENVFREDIVVNGEDRENLLSNAPEQKDGCFLVPKTVE